MKKPNNTMKEPNHTKFLADRSIIDLDIICDEIKELQLNNSQNIYIEDVVQVLAETVRVELKAIHKELKALRYICSQQ